MILSIVQFLVDEKLPAGKAGTMDAPRKVLVDTLARRPDLDLKNLSRSAAIATCTVPDARSPRELPEAGMAWLPARGLAG